MTEIALRRCSYASFCTSEWVVDKLFVVVRCFSCRNLDMRFDYLQRGITCLHNKQISQSVVNNMYWTFGVVEGILTHLGFFASSDASLLFDLLVWSDRLLICDLIICRIELLDPCNVFYVPGKDNREPSNATLQFLKQFFLMRRVYNP